MWEYLGCSDLVQIIDQLMDDYIKNLDSGVLKGNPGPHCHSRNFFVVVVVLREAVYQYINSCALLL